MDKNEKVDRQSEVQTDWRTDNYRKTYTKYVRAKHVNKRTNKPTLRRRTDWKIEVVKESERNDGNGEKR